MNENQTNQNEITFGFIFKSLWKKIKLLILVLIAGIVVGGSIGILRTCNLRYDGASIHFYINPKDPDREYGVSGAYGSHVMSTLVDVLNEDAFMEKLHLDENGLPAKGISADIDAKIDEALAAKPALDNATQVEKAKKADWDNAAFNTESKKILLEASPNDVAAAQAYNAAREVEHAAKVAYETAVAAKATAKATFDEKANAAVLEWRKTDNHRALVGKTQASVEFSRGTQTTTTADGDTSTSGSFIYVNIYVLNSPTLAQRLYERALKVVPQFVAANLLKAENYQGTNCIVTNILTRVSELNANQMISTAVKYGLLLGFAALLVACIVVVIVDRSDKRLGDFEQAMSDMDIPVLGIIPSFEEDATTQEGSQKKDNEGEN